MKRVKSWQKKADRWVGVPILFVLSLWVQLKSFIRPQCPPAHPQSLALLCVAALGDLILLSQSIRDFKEKFPGCQITLFCGPDNHGLVPLIDPERKLFAAVHTLNPRKFFSDLKVLRSQNFDLVIDSGQWSRWSALMALLIPAAWRVGFQTAGQARHLTWDQAVPHQGSVHEILNFQALFRNWLGPHRPSDGIIQHSHSRSSSQNIVCHLFPSGQNSHQKEWPASSWLQLFADFKSWGFQIHLTGGPLDRARLRQLFRPDELQGLHDHVGKMSLAETRDLLQNSALLITVNTGIMHLAASLDLPLVALHGPTDPVRWGPVSKSAQVLQSHLPCSPCLSLGFEYGCPSQSCMASIRPQEVSDLARKLLKIPESSRIL